MSATETKNPTPPMTPDRAIDLFIRLRAKKEALVERHKEELRPFTEALAALETTLLGILDSAGLQNMKSDAGTAYKRIETSVTVDNWQATLDWIVANEAWEFLEARVNKTATKDLMEEKGEPPPGVVVRQEARVGVRKAAV